MTGVQTCALPIFFRFLLTPLQKALGKTAQPATDMYKRFTGEYLVQKWVLTLSLIIIGAVSNAARKHQDVVELDRQPMIYEEEEVESPERDGRYVRNEGEIEIPFGKTYRPESPSGIPRQEEENIGNSPSNFSNNTTVTQIPAKKQVQVTSTSTKKTAITPTVPKKTATSLCENVHKTGGWYIQDNQFSVKERAELRVSALKKENIACDYFNGGCLGVEGWIVRLGSNLKSEKAARDKSLELGNLLQKKGLKTGIPLPKKVPD